MAIRVALLTSLPFLVAAHSNVIVPRPRNAIDALTDPRFGSCSLGHGCAPLNNGQGHCDYGASCGCQCVNGTSPCDIGQTCFWFSQGCSIGCPTCTGVKARDQVDICGLGMKAVVCDPRLRTYNVLAACNSEADLYRHNPWRAPGTAPVFDPCGKAGGGYPDPRGLGPGAADFINTTNAKHGDLGSEVLKPGPSQARWKAGSEVETVWGLRANHGGGFQWRLCPLSANLTEECFQRMPLPFVGRQYLQYPNGTRTLIPSKYAYANGSVAAITADGQMPIGITWATNPLPDGVQKGSVGNFSKDGKWEFEPPCDSVEMDGNTNLCSGERPFAISVVDIVKIPKGTAPGNYVLGWRWDVEETAQVWSTCSDITIV
eukprot:TRINITY_DN977_c0_g2_i1.p1 TRINITY_DN977_c0_g2~~TRINITY_DN977_c0_g2_i1.p1  ORF type:complete len:373 (+),score=31.12 TRINITY_DN977_c0_g2_i1:132-1250(+)